MIIGVIGKPRSGKTTYLASFVSRNNRNVFFNSLLDRIHFPSRFRFHVYAKIYSTEAIKGTYIISSPDVGLFEPVQDSLFIIDEAGCDFSNRLYKSIERYQTDFFAQHGHYLCDIVWGSQTVDVDKKLRNRTEFLYIVSKCHIGLLSDLSFLKRVDYLIGVNNESHDIVEGYSIPEGIWKVLRYLLGVNRFLWRPFYYRLFDTHSKRLEFKRPELLYNKRYGEEEEKYRKEHENDSSASGSSSRGIGKN